MIKRLIFDVDGTLISGVSFIPATEKALKKVNLYSKENAVKIQGNYMIYEKNYNSYNKKDYLNHISKCIGTTVDERFLDIFFEELGLCISKNNEKLIKTLEVLSQKYELVLLTNYFEIVQMTRLKNMKIDKYFLECFGEDLIKPNKDAFLKACGKYKPCECVMIGDNIKLDVEAALNSGLKAIWITEEKENFDNIIKIDKVVCESPRNGIDCFLYLHFFSFSESFCVVF